MRLFVGLGNPGGKYEKTRHNIGFLAVDAIADAHGFPAGRGKFQGLFSEGRVGGERVLILQPETFMNLSGQAIGEAMRYYKLAPEDVVVFHDELDLAPGRVKVKQGGGHAGHNGLRSTHEHIGADFHRVRMGIGHPGDKRLVSGYVLHEFAKADWEWIDPLLDAMARAAPALAKGDAPGFMTHVARQLQPPKSEAKNTAPKKAAPSKPAATPPAAEAPAPPPAEPKPTAAAPEPSSALGRLLSHFSKR
ncbi:MAG: aminoacyl-tRNA hydrolase [Pseudomonadota bacterium]